VDGAVDGLGVDLGVELVGDVGVAHDRVGEAVERGRREADEEGEDHRRATTGARRRLKSGAARLARCERRRVGQP